MNVISISGGIGNSELKKVGGYDLLEFSVAVKKYDKNDKDAIEWFNCCLWGDRAAKLAQYVVKGAGVAVSGEMQVNYDKEKKTCYPKVKAMNIDIIKWANTEEPKPVQQEPKKEYSGLDNFMPMGNDDDIPF